MVHSVVTVGENVALEFWYFLENLGEN